MLGKAYRLARWKMYMLILHLRVAVASKAMGSGAGLEPMPRVAISHYVALSEFAHNLERVRVQREWLQSRRVRSDEELLPLFHNALDPSYNDEKYIRFHHWLAAVLGLDQRFRKGEG